MNYLKDSCVFIDHLKSTEQIMGVLMYCRSRDEKVCISQKILDELHPGKGVAEENRTLAHELYKYVENAIRTSFIELIEIEQNKDIQTKYNQIRETHYKWMKDNRYLQKLISEGKLTKEEIKNKAFRHKDEGECTLIAIALVSPKIYTIITEDKGRVYKHPHINLFDTYAVPNGVKVMGYMEWKDYIEYEE